MPQPDLQPTLIGPRITVRPLRPEDWSGLLSAASDPLVWEQHPIRDRYREDQFRIYFQDALNCGSAFTFEHRKSGNLIGSSRYHGYNETLSEIEIGWTFLSRSFWGGSYNKEVKQLMLGYAFNFIDTVVFWVGANNMRSRKAVQKIGGVQRQGDFSRRHDEVEFPYVVYELSRENYKL